MAAEQPIAKTAEQPLQLLDTSAEAGAVESPQLSTSERKLRLAEVLVAKTAQGYSIESQTDTEATLTTKGHRRWLGMVGSNSQTREITSIDEQGRTRTRPA